MRIETPSTQDRLERQLIDDAQRKKLNAGERWWAYAAGVASINDSERDYTIPEIKRMWKKNPMHLASLLDAQTGGDGGTKNQGQAELARRIGVAQTTISYYLDYFDTENTPEEALVCSLPGLLGPEDMHHIGRIKDPETKKVLIASAAREKQEAFDKGHISRRQTSVKKRIDAIREIEEKAEHFKAHHVTTIIHEIPPVEKTVLSGSGKAV